MSNVQKLMTALGLPTVNSLQEMVDVTQKEWLRAVGKERWQIENTQEDKRSLVMPYLKQLNLVDAIEPMYQEYDYAVVLGATITSMQFRLRYLQECWDKGVRFKQIVCLVGQRFLDKQKELDLLAAQGVTKDDMPVTETDALRYLLDTITRTHGLEDIPVVVIDTPGSTAPNGTYCRPTTEDTVIEWLKTNPKPGAILAISNQPYCVYQHVVLATVLPKEFNVFANLHVVGAKAAESVTVAVYLDSLARILYQLNKSGYSSLEKVMAYTPNSNA